MQNVRVVREEWKTIYYCDRCGNGYLKEEPPNENEQCQSCNQRMEVAHSDHKIL